MRSDDAWIGGSIPGALGSDPVGIAGVDGQGDPQVMIVWQNGSGNASQLLAVTGSDDGAGYEWSTPELVGTVDVSNSGAALALVGSEPLLVWQKTDADIVDDTDLYFQRLGGAQPNPEGELQNGDGCGSCEGGCESGSPGDDHWAFQAQREAYVPQSIALLGGFSSFSIAGKLPGTVDECAFNAEGDLPAVLELFGGTVRKEGTFHGTVTGHAAPDECNCCGWAFDQAEVSGSLDVTKHISSSPMALGGLATLAAEADVTASVSGSLELTGTDSWFTNSDLAVQANLQGRGTVSIMGNTAPVQGTGTASGVIDAKGFRFESVDVNLSASVGVFSHLTAHWSKRWQWPAQKAAGEAEGFGGLFDNVTFDSRVGTGNVYSGATVLSTADTDLYNDGAPVVLTLAGGETLLAWTKDSDGSAWFGSALTVATFDGSAWSAPTEIPDSRGFGFQPAAVVDSEGDPMLIWPLADSSGLSLNDPVDEHMDRMLSTDLVYSVRKNGTWSSPATVGAIDAFDRDVAAATLPDGRIAVAWVNDGDASESILASFFDQGAWTTAEIAAEGSHLSNVVVTVVDGNPEIYWTSGQEIQQDAVESVLMVSVWDDGWSTPEPFTLGTSAPAAGGSGEAPPASAPNQESGTGSQDGLTSSGAGRSAAAEGDAGSGTARGGSPQAPSSSEGEPGATIVVNTIGDDPDIDPNDGVCDASLLEIGEQCTLRAAIEQSNQRAGKDTIAFNLPGGTPTFEPQSPLPTVTDAVIIDGSTQSGGRVQLYGGDAGTPSGGLTFTTGDSLVKGFRIFDFHTVGIHASSVDGDLALEDVVLENNTKGVSFAQNTSGRLVLQGQQNSVVGNRGHGIHLASGVVQVTGQTEIYDNEGWGIYAEDGTNGTYIDDGAMTKINNNDGGGIRATGTLELPADFVVEDNGGPGIRALDIEASELVFEGLKVRNNQGDGIGLLHDSGSGPTIVLEGTGNEIVNNDGHGIITYGGSVHITGQTEIRGNGGWGVRSEDNTVGVVIDQGAMSKINNNGQGGIFTCGNLALPTGFVVEDNDGPGLLVIDYVHDEWRLEGVVVRNNKGDGIGLLQVVDSALIIVLAGTGNTIVNNTGHGISTQEGGGVHIKGQTAIHDNGGWGIHVKDGASGVVIDQGAMWQINKNGQGGIYSRGNLVLPPGFVVSENGGPGLVFDDVSEGCLAIEGVKVRDNKGHGIHLVHATSLLLTGTGNEVIHNGGHGIVVSDRSVTASNLTVTHNRGDGILARDVTINNGKVCYNGGQQIHPAAQQNLTDVDLCETILPAPSAPPAPECCDKDNEKLDAIAPPKVPTVKVTGKVSESAGSRDPNEKVGLGGHGAENYVAAGRLLPYRVNFENESEATAPAQVVTINDQLSENLDWSSFEFTQFGFGSHVIPAPAGSQYFEWVEPMQYNGAGLDVHIEAWLDLDSGLVEARFWTTDQQTDLPPDVPTGFLPPEDGSGRGMGHVSYVIDPKGGLATGTEIRNVATIQFDFGEVIDTNQVDPHDPSQGTDPNKEALVTMDAGAPNSAVDPLPDTVRGSNLQVTWSGTDDGSGIATYDVYVSDNGGPFQPWLRDTTATSANYAGQFEGTYGFYTVATDYAGHRETVPNVADATTTVDAAPIATSGNHLVRSFGRIGAQEVDEFDLDLRQGPAHGVYLLHVVSDDGLDPDSVEVLDANGNPMPLREAVPDLGAGESCVVVSLSPGQYKIRLRGQNGAAGNYRLDVRMPGAINGDGTVPDRHVQLAEAAMLQRYFGFNAIAQELFGNKLGIDLSTDQFRAEFDANLNGHIDPTDMHAIVANNDPAVPVEIALTAAAGGNGEAADAEAEPAARFQLSNVSFSVYQNPENPTDVNADRQVTAQDALLVINALNAIGSTSIDALGGAAATIGEGEHTAAISPPFFDVSGDYRITPLDVLLVVNHLNDAAPTAIPEGEAPGTMIGLTGGNSPVLLHAIDILMASNQSPTASASNTVDAVAPLDVPSDRDPSAAVAQRAVASSADGAEIPAEAKLFGDTDQVADLLDSELELLESLAEDVSGVWNA